MTEKLICAVCPTFNRPELLGRSIKCFERQTYPNKHLIIVDDLGQYDNQSGEQWELISIPKRIISLGEKRNFGASLAPKNVWAYAVWDDDDFYYPWHLESLAYSLQRSDVVQPRLAIDFWGGKRVLVETFKRTSRGRSKPTTKPTFCYHGCWGYSVELFNRLGGYRRKYADDDCEFQTRLLKSSVSSVDISSKYKPSYVYNRRLSVRISNQGNATSENYWKMQEHKSVDFIGKVPEWIYESDWEEEIPTEVIPRPW